MAAIQTGRFAQTIPASWGPWQIHCSRELWNSHFLRVAVDEVTRPDGKPGEHVVVAIKPGVCVLALDPGGCLRMTREFHYAIGRESIEAVSGGIDGNETALDCAKRELREELGWEAISWKVLTTVDPFTSILVSPTVVFLASGLRRVATDREGTEQIEELAIPLEEAVQRVASGGITHAPTAVGILLVARQLASPGAGAGVSLQPGRSA